MAEGRVAYWNPNLANTVDLTQRASDYTMTSAKAAGEVTNAAAGMLVEPIGMAQDTADAVQSVKEGDWLGLGLAAGSFIGPGCVPKEAREDACKAARNAANHGKIRNPFGTKGKPDHQAKVAELEKKAIDEMLPGEKMLREHGLQGNQPIKRRPDVQIIDPSGKTRKVFEAERNPESKRHRERIEAYEKNDIEHETHPLE